MELPARVELDLRFDGEIWYWRGPAPFYFITVPEQECAQIRAVAKAVTYGWGMIPVEAEIGATVWETSMFAKNGGYVLPVKDVVRKAEDLDDGDTVTVQLAIRSADRR